MGGLANLGFLLARHGGTYWSGNHTAASRGLSAYPGARTPPEDGDGVTTMEAPTRKRRARGPFWYRSLQVALQVPVPMQAVHVGQAARATCLPPESRLHVPGILIKSPARAYERQNKDMERYVVSEYIWRRKRIQGVHFDRRGAAPLISPRVLVCTSPFTRGSITGVTEVSQ